MTTPLLRTRTRNPYGTIGQKASSTNPHGGINPHAPEKRGDWVMRAKCRDVDPDSLFVTGAEQRQAAEINPAQEPTRDQLVRILVQRWRTDRPLG